MSTPVISVENLSKRYFVGHRENRGAEHGYTALRDVVAREIRNFTRKASEVARGRQVVQGDSLEEYWALKAVSFEVQRGEVLGIIGRNGAGKSTLLKILSRITEPTTGRVTLRGRVASLLEVGTGFHPELSGRENIYLNGSILGMTRGEIRRKFDEIVAFAEVDRFLDTPVKRYSSGMYVRLAFAVAAHLEPEVLIVDEVLAVGDAEFQKKCLGKIDEVSRRDGRTVLFVSHNMAAIAELADRAILLENGSVAQNGAVSNIVATYLAKSQKRGVYVSPHITGYDTPHVARAEVLTSRANSLQSFNEPLDVKVWIKHPESLPQGCCLGVHIVNQLHITVTTLHALPPQFIFGKQPGTTELHFRIPQIRLNQGNFYLRLYLTGPPKGKTYEIVDSVCDFEVTRDNFFSWWGPEICAYHEEFTVGIVEHGLEVSSCEVGSPVETRLPQLAVNS